MFVTDLLIIGSTDLEIDDAARVIKQVPAGAISRGAFAFSTVAETVILDGKPPRRIACARLVFESIPGVELVSRTFVVVPGGIPVERGAPQVGELEFVTCVMHPTSGRPIAIYTVECMTS